MTMDSTQRFSDRVDDYVRYRPSYPADLVRVLEQEAGLTTAEIVADIGSGTGISSQLFLDHGNAVFAVEPNREMRLAAEKQLSANPRFHSVDGTAEHTTLADHSVDFIIAGQAFHWFNRQQTRQEFNRILRPGGYVILMWNDRRLDSTPFLRDYEALLSKFGIDYQQVNHTNVDERAIADFYAPASFQIRKLENNQRLDLAGLTGRITSSSYMPGIDHPRYQQMLEAIEHLFEQRQRGGRVTIEYDTVLYFGQFD
jgi:SAM-dependent methyltransferase